MQVFQIKGEILHIIYEILETFALFILNTFQKSLEIAAIFMKKYFRLFANYNTI